MPSHRHYKRPMNNLPLRPPRPRGQRPAITEQIVIDPARLPELLADLRQKWADSKDPLERQMLAGFIAAMAEAQILANSPDYDAEPKPDEVRMELVKDTEDGTIYDMILRRDESVRLRLTAHTTYGPDGEPTTHVAAEVRHEDHWPIMRPYLDALMAHAPWTARFTNEDNPPC